MLEDIDLSKNDQPKYRQLANAIAERIQRGDLAAGERLPPQRDIARSLGINLTTVTRAFTALQQSGLVEARPGRGTQVASSEDGSQGDFQSAPADVSGFIDLAVNRPATSAYLEELAMVLPRLPKDRRFSNLQDYQVPEGPAWARSTIAAWLSKLAGTGEANRVILTDGAQHGLACVLAGVTQPADVILADAITYQGINGICRLRGLDLRGVPMDRDGMLPDALESACERWRPRAVFLVPSLHNPTATTLSERRRRTIVAILQRYNVLIIEDDVYRPLLDEQVPSFASLEPELTIYISGLSKCVAPGLRLGFVVAPRALVGDVAGALRIDSWTVSPLTALIGTVMLEDGLVDTIIERHKEEIRLRQAIVRELLGDLDLQTHENSPQAWLHLPEPWRGNSFARIAREKGVGVLAAEAFTVGREAAPHAVRINVGAARSRSDLRLALEKLAELVNSGRPHLHDVT